MLKRQFRLKNNSAFSATYRLKNSYYKSGIALFVGKQKEDLTQPTKVGFVVSKKTHKRAVKRNRLKRLMRESYRLLLKDRKVGISQNAISLIFVGHERALGKNFNEINSIITHLLGEIKW